MSALVQMCIAKSDELLRKVTDLECEIAGVAAEIRVMGSQLNGDEESDEVMQRAKPLKEKAVELVGLLEKLDDAKRALDEADMALFRAKCNQLARMEKEYPTAGAPRSKQNPRWDF